MTEALNPKARASLFNLSNDELLQLHDSHWHAFVELGFPNGISVHPGVFTVISATLQKRPHFSFRMEQTVCVTMALEDGSDEARRRAHELGAGLASMIPNAVLEWVDIEEYDRH